MQFYYIVTGRGSEMLGVIPARSFEEAAKKCHGVLDKDRIYSKQRRVIFTEDTFPRDKEGHPLWSRLQRRFGGRAFTGRLGKEFFYLHELRKVPRQFHLPLISTE